MRSLRFAHPTRVVLHRRYSLIFAEEQLDVGFEGPHIGAPLLVEGAAIDADRFVEELVDDFLAEEGVGRELAEAAVEGEEFIEVFFHEEVGEGPGLAVAVERGAEGGGVVEDLIADDETDVGVLTVALQGAVGHEALFIDGTDAAPSRAVGRFEVSGEAFVDPAWDADVAG